MTKPTLRVQVLDSTVADWRAPVRCLLLAWVTGLALATGGCGSDPATSASGGGTSSTGGAQGGHGGTQGGGGHGGSMTGGTGGGGGTTTTSSGGGGAGGTGGAGGSGDVPPTPICVESCQTSDDCIHAGQVYSADNYECAGGKCKYLGCKTDDECFNTFGAMAGVCLAGSGSAAIPLCVKGCQTSDDCIQAGQVFSADNYECAGGKCKWLGCNSDDECFNTFGAVSGVCLAGGGSGTTPSCVESCQTSDDCIHAGQVFSADNYECAGGKCKWLGCDSDDECLNTFGAVSDVCL